MSFCFAADFLDAARNKAHSVLVFVVFLYFFFLRVFKKFVFFGYLLPMPPLSRHPYCSSLCLIFFLLLNTLLLVLSGSKDELLFHVDMLILKQ